MFSEWLYLRQECRIVGALIGTLGQAPRQVDFSGLPMLLSAQEIDVLLNQGKISLFKLKSDHFSEDYINKYQLHQEQVYQEQIELFRVEREKEIRRKGDQIVDGKMRKNKSLTADDGDADAEIIIDDDDQHAKEKILREEISKIPSLPKHQALLQTCLEQPWIDHETNDAKELVENWKYLGNELKRLVFADLWHKGFFVTDGTKFGGDFLVYPGDPIHFHAKYVVICQASSVTDIKETDLVTRSRLGSSTKKTVLLATQKDEREIQYHAVKWTER